MTTIQSKPGFSLVLRCNSSQDRSYNNFSWDYPLGSEVIAPDWKPIPECGNGLHGWLNGEGEIYCSDHYADSNAIWKILEVETASLINLDGKVKFPKATILFSGKREETIAKMLESCPGRAVHYAKVMAEKTAVVGDCGFATAGNDGTATAGDDGTATAGDDGTATAGNYGTATAGYRGTATAGNDGTATAGYNGTATAGNNGTATAGDSGTATAGDDGTATAGNHGTATAGIGGTATAGNYGTIQIKYWDSKTNRSRIAIGYIGEDGLKPNVQYKLDESHRFVKA